MLYKCTFPVVTSLLLSEHWPVQAGDLKIEWKTENGLIIEVSVSAPMAESDQLPGVSQSTTPGIALDVYLADSVQHDRIEQKLRTVQGILHLFSAIEIDFDAVKVDWIPDSDAERSQLKMFSYVRKVERANVNEPRTLGFEFITRAIASADAAASFEIPLNFLRRGNKDIHAGRYIEAFYNLFFFLETLYAPGFSNPGKVKHKLLSASTVVDSLKKAKGKLSANQKVRSPRLSQLLLLSDTDLIGHLVDLRGTLHHHALPREGIWHPDKPGEFREEAFILQDLVHEIAMGEMMPIFFSAECARDVMQYAERAGAILSLRIESIAIVNGVEKAMESVRFRIPGKSVNKEIVNSIDLKLRKTFPGGTHDAELKEYRIMSDDHVHCYAVYKRPL